MSAPAPAPDSTLLDHGLTAQARMLPYVLGFFGIGLPLFLWAAKAGVSPELIALYLVSFTIAWPAFMALRNASERLAGAAQTPRMLSKRLWRQGIGGGLWACIVLLVSLTGMSGGSSADMLLTLCAGAAVGIIFFSAPVLIHLLVLGPLAVAGPMIAMQVVHEDSSVTRLANGGLVLALSMGFILNRHMRDHYRLQAEALAASREREDASAGKMALMETLSREVKTGLTGVEQALSQAVQHLNRAPAPRQQVETALSAIEHLKSILVTTIDNDGAQAGQIEVVHQPLDIVLMCERMAGEFADSARSRDLAFGMAASDLPSVGAVVADPHRVEQIVHHLLDNAIQYTPSGRVELKLLPLGDFIRVEVVDSGPGLTPQELEYAFAPHSRIARTSSGTSGAGLGLSLSRSLAELMGGRMGADSTPDVGSKFWVDLPFDMSATAPARPVVPEIETHDSDHSLRVLLLANDSLRAAQLRDQLEDLGHRCLTSTSRERALALAKKGGVDACVISTGAFENLHDDGNRDTLNRFLDSLRATQTEAHLNIVALLPAGDQVEALQAMGVKPLLLPQGRDSLARALT